MIAVTLQFDRRLAPLLAAPARAAGVVRRDLPGPTSLKDAVEALGIPHCEVAGARDADGNERGLSHVITGPGAFSVAGVVHADPRAGRFLCDRHLGGLVHLLRVMGLDTAWGRDWQEPEVVRRGLNEDRIVLSRSRALLKRRALVDAMLVRSDEPGDQAVEVLRRYRLAGAVDLFGRCSRCNGAVRPVDKAAVAGRIPPRTAAWLDTYFVCADCDQLYWEGTHVLGLRPRLEGLLARARREAP